MNVQECLAEFTQEFKQVSQSLFEQNGRRVHMLTEQDPGVFSFDASTMPVACVQASCKDFSLVFTINMPYSTLLMTYPASTNTGIGKPELDDWLCELSNRLMGLFILSVESVGGALKMGLPQFDFGTDFLQTLPGDAFTRFAFTDLDGDIIRASMQLQLYSSSVSLNAFSTSLPQSSIAAGEIDFL